MKMSNHILVAYASRTGSTVGVAEAIGNALRRQGAEVDVCPVEAVTDLSPYQAVVVGSAIQGKQWLPEAMDFIKLHQQALMKLPTAAFLVCMTLTMRDGQYRPEVMKWLDPVRHIIKPVSEGYFAGRLETSRIPSIQDRLKFRVSVALGAFSEGDHRDWNAIRDWAAELKPLLAA
jgi:menaquinone-dependent protoporphyrinogen oxidase